MAKRNRHQSQSSPLDPQADPSRGNTLGAPNGLGRERAVVLTVDAERHAYRVVTASGRTFTVGRLRTHPGDTALLAPHTPVRIDYSLGEPYIDAILPAEVPLRGETNSGATGTSGHGGADAVLSRNLGASFRAPGEPSDLIPGDQAVRSPDGAQVAALHGKVAKIFGSPMAQMRVFGTTDAAEIIAGVLRVITWMGESRYVNEEGKTSFVWRGGSDQLTETGPDEERYTLRLDVGHRGDLFKFEVTTPDGQPVFRLHVDPHGKVTVLAADGLNSIVGREPGSRFVDQVHGSRETVTEGGVTERVSGDHAATYQGNHEVTVSGRHAEIALHDRSVRVNRGLNVGVGADEVRNVGGDRTTTVVGDEALHVRGDLDVDATNIDATATGTAKTTAPTVHLSSPSVKLGRAPVSHAVRFEQMQAAIQALNADISAMKVQLRLHTHPVVLTPVPLAQPSPTLAASPTLSAFPLNLGAARSTTVTLE